jgi:hypothetical protein
MPVVSLTRQALYDAVWEKPISKLAPEYGVTGTGLKKICDRHNVPTPDRGYWAKLAHGKPGRRRPLPVKGLSAEAEVSFHGTPESQLPASVRAAMDRALAEVAAKIDDPTRLPPTENPAPSERSAITQRLSKALARAKPDVAGFVPIGGDDLPSLLIGPDSFHRAEDTIEALVRGAEALGWTFAPSPTGLTLVIDSVPIAFGLVEKVARIPHQPTPKEIREKEQAEKRGWYHRPWPATDPAPSGVLTFEIRENAYGPLTRRFSDLKKRPLPLRLDEILAVCAAHGALKAEARRKAEIERVRREKWEAEQRRQKAFDAREKRRVEFVEHVHSLLAERSRLQATSDHLASLDKAGRQAIEDMAGWIAFRLKRIEALLSVEFLDISIGSAEVEFAEPAETDPKVDRDYYYYARSAEPRLWSIDRLRLQATEVGTYRWARENAALPIRQADEPADLRPG